MAKAEYKIPFDDNGNMLTYDRRYQIEWRDNCQFEDTLTYKCYGRGRSSAVFVFTKSDGKTVSMFMTDIDDIIPKMVNGVLSGTFTYTKRGTNYGIKLVAN